MEEKEEEEKEGPAADLRTMPALASLRHASSLPAKPVPNHGTTPGVKAAVSHGWRTLGLWRRAAEKHSRGCDRLPQFEFPQVVGAAHDNDSVEGAWSCRSRRRCCCCSVLA